MHWYNFLITIILSGFIGWGISWVIIKMMFYPRKPINFPGYKLQGIFPKNQSLIAEMLGKMVSTDLLPFDDIEQRITSTENLEKLKPEIEKHVDNFLNHKLRDVFPILSKFIGVKTTSQLKEAFLIELESIFPVMINRYMIQLKSNIDVKKIVVEKVEGFSTEKLESVLKQITKKEFQFLQFTGAAFGCIIGAIQVVINTIAH
jgi:uncharacterized membrane protein YheB (UPF0754 family)